MTQKIAILVDDLFFAVKISSAAAACASEIERVKSREQLEQLVANPPALVIIDLNSGLLNPVEVIEFLKSTPALGDVPIVGFVSHIQTDLISLARAAGCDYVLPRSAFAQKLNAIVAGNLSGLSATK